MNPMGEGDNSDSGDSDPEVPVFWMNPMSEGQNSHSDDSNWELPAFSRLYPRWFMSEDDVLFVIKAPGATPEPDGDYSNKEKIKIPPSPPIVCQFKLKKIHDEGFKRQHIETAGTALAYYNKKHHTDYELVDALGSGAHFIKGTIWFHTSFTAKLTTPGDGESSSAKLFFAEYCHGPEELEFYCCRLLGDGVKTQKGCHRCGEHLVHPTSGFRQGLYPDADRVL